MLQIYSTDTPNLVGLHQTIEESVEEGIRIADTTELKKLVQDQRDKYRKELQDVYGILNPNSSKQVIEAFKQLALGEVPCIFDICYDEAKDKWTTNAEKLAELKMLEIPIAFTLSNYRVLNNILSTLNTLDDLKDKNGFVHPVVSYGKTGRINYSNPALMNINKKVLWSCIVPRDDDSTLYSIDIKNQEPWILINMLGIESLSQVIGSKGLYESMFKEWFGHMPDEIERKEFKTSWNALTYGASKKLIVERCKHIDGGIIYNNFKNIPELDAYKKECTAKGYGNKRACETIFGTQLECDGNRGMALARQQMDYRIQGTGVDILSFLNDNLSDRAAELGYDEMIHPYFFRHDELIVSISNALIDTIGEDAVEAFLKDTFEHQIDNWVPFQVEISKVAGVSDLSSLMTDDDE